MQKALAGAALAAALFSVFPAAADEVWTSPSAGRIIYEEDIRETGIFSYDGLSGGRAYLYVPGIAGTSERYVHFGYWIDPTRGDECGTQLTGPDGVRSGSWGTAVIAFDRPEFPSGWTALLGLCGSEPFEHIRAEAN